MFWPILVNIEPFVVDSCRKEERNKMITEVITVNTIVITDTTEAYCAITNVITVNTIVITLQNVNFILLTTVYAAESNLSSWNGYSHLLNEVLCIFSCVQQLLQHLYI